MEGIDRKVFEEMGFTNGEISVYFSLLDSGLSTIGPISKSAGITPAKVYPILDKLARKGLVKHIIKEGIRHFEATHPDNIIRYLEEKEKIIEKEKKKISKMIPYILQNKPAEHERKAEVFEGLGGVKAYFNSLLEISSPGDVWLGFTLGEEYLSPQANSFFHNLHTERIKRDIHIKLLAPESQRHFQKRKRKDRGHAKMRFISWPIPTGVTVVYDKVSILLWDQKPILFAIKSKRNAEVFRRFFLQLWKMSKR
jgi:sugar-specific transcriptional regulator TrmB